MTDPYPLRLLTFNCWGLKYISSLRKERLEGIANRLANPIDDDEVYDVVALQEIWCEEDWQYIKEKCKVQYPYRRIFKSGIISGPGLAILSKIPIESSFLYRFPINGRSSAFFRGDWYVGKSISVSILNDPSVEGFVPIAILNSHMHAPYGDHTGDAGYGCHRACQAWDFAKIINLLKKSGYAVIQVGDLNSKPGSLPYKLFTIEGGLVDSWEQNLALNKLPRSNHGSPTSSSSNTIDATNSAGNVAVSTATATANGTLPLAHTSSNNDRVEDNHDTVAFMSLTDQVKLGGVTCDSKLNTWRSFKKQEDACRLDYAFIDQSRITTVNAKVVFTERLPPPYDCSYSDHFAYSAEFLIKNNAKATPVTKAVDRIAVYKELLFELNEYQRFTIPQQIFWRKWHFILGMMSVLLFHFITPLASVWNPLYPLIILALSTIIGISSVLNGLIWYFGVRSESRALQEVQMEVEDIFNSISFE